MVMHLLWCVKQNCHVLLMLLSNSGTSSLELILPIFVPTACANISVKGHVPCCWTNVSHCANSACKFHSFPICAYTALAAYMYSPTLPLTWQVLAMHVCKKEQTNGWNPLFALRTVRLAKSCQQYSWPLANKNNLVCKCTDLAKLQDFPNKLYDLVIDLYLVSGWGRGAVLFFNLTVNEFSSLDLGVDILRKV